MVVDPGPRLSEIVTFEVPHQLRAESLADRLRLLWFVWVEPREDGWLVVAQLRAEIDDFCLLLRQAEAWATERRLPGLPFQVDGRAYLLRPAVDTVPATR